MSNSFATLWTIACQAPLPMGFPRQKYWNGLPFPSAGNLLDPGTEPTSLASAGGFFTTEPPGKPKPFFAVGQSPSCVQFFVTTWTAAHQLSLFFLISQSLLKLMSTKLVMLSSYLIFSSPLLLPSTFPDIRIFFNELFLCIRWPNYGSLSFSISPSNEYSGLISFRIDWFDLLVVQASQESSPAPQLKSISSLVLSLLYGPTLTSVMTTGKKHSFDYTDLCWQTDVSAF